MESVTSGLLQSLVHLQDQVQGTGRQAGFSRVQTKLWPSSLFDMSCVGFVCLFVLPWSFLVLPEI